MKRAANQIAASDFVPCDESALEKYLKSLLYSPEWDSPASAERFAAVLEQLRKPAMTIVPRLGAESACTQIMMEAGIFAVAWFSVPF
jgi:hypothetical protein